jgi:hypothetical protein
VPAILLYFSKKIVVYHHFGAARFVVMQAYKTAIAKFICPVGYFFGQYMCMYIYF